MDQGSQHREHFAASIRPLELWCQRRHVVVQCIPKHLHDAHLLQGRLPMVDQQLGELRGADWGCRLVKPEKAVIRTFVTTTGSSRAP